MTAELFKREIGAAVRAFEKYIVCLEKSPEEFRAALASLMVKAINAYEHRGPNMRHGIALDKHVTIILSQTDSERPLCGIYFNLHSPYQKTASPKAAKAVAQKPEGAADTEN